MKTTNLYYFFIFWTLFLLFPKPIYAEDSIDITKNITVSPPKFELKASPGEKITQSLKITNDDDQDYIFALSVDSVAFTGENGEVIVGTSNPNLSGLLSAWVKFEKSSGTLNANSIEIINFSLDIPKGVASGGKYASLVIGLDKIDRESGKSLGQAKIVSLILLTISGGFQDNAKIIEFGVNSKTSQFVSFILRIRNQDVNHIKPNGSIVVSNIFGKKVSEITLSGDNILPGSVRKTIVDWEPEKDLFGYYTATVVTRYGYNTQKSASSSLAFYVLPFWRTLVFCISTIFCLFVAILIGRIVGLFIKRKYK